MNKKQLYENIMTSVAKEVKKALNEASDTFNNGEAYRFLKIYVTKAVIMTLGENNAEINTSTDAAKMKIKIGRSKKDVNLTMCYNNLNEVAVSQSKMMYMKNILFITDNKIYIVDGDLLRANWGNKSVCAIDSNVYRDRLKEASKMSRFNLNFLKANASDVISMSDDAIIMYNDAYNKMSIQ